jgi:hypothetical protein
VRGPEPCPRHHRLRPAIPPAVIVVAVLALDVPVRPALGEYAWFSLSRFWFPVPTLAACSSGWGRLKTAQFRLSPFISALAGDGVV